MGDVIKLENKVDSISLAFQQRLEDFDSRIQSFQQRDLSPVMEFFDAMSKRSASRPKPQSLLQDLDALESLKVDVRSLQTQIVAMSTAHDNNLECLSHNLAESCVKLEERIQIKSDLIDNHIGSVNKHVNELSASVADNLSAFQKSMVTDFERVTADYDQELSALKERGDGLEARLDSVALLLDRKTTGQAAPIPSPPNRAFEARFAALEACVESLEPLAAVCSDVAAFAPWQQVRSLVSSTSSDLRQLIADTSAVVVEDIDHKLQVAVSTSFDKASALIGKVSAVFEKRFKALENQLSKSHG